MKEEREEAMIKQQKRRLCRGIDAQNTKSDTNVHTRKLLVVTNVYTIFSEAELNLGYFKSCLELF